MPIPKPKKGESKDDFISRCMSDEDMKEYSADPKSNQRYAVCISKWESKNEDNILVDILDGLDEELKR